MEKKEQFAFDLISDLLDCSNFLPDLITAWHGIYVVAVLENIIPSFHTGTRPMPPGYVYFLLKDLRHRNITQRVGRAARYMSAPKIKKYPEIWHHLFHFFLVL